MRRRHTVGTNLVRPNDAWGHPMDFDSTALKIWRMALRRRLIWVLPRHTRLNPSRGQRLWSIQRPPHSSINARPYQYLGLAGRATLAGSHNSPSNMSPQDPAMTQAEQTPQPDGSEEDTKTAIDEEEPETPAVETWHEAVDAIVEATRSAFPNSPAFDADSPGAFQAYWRGVFARLHESVAADRTIPEQLTSPTCRTFWVNVFSRSPAAEQACPCCLPWVEPSVRLENEAGVTKGDLVAGLGRFLYGGGRPPRVYVEDVGAEDGVVPEVEGAQRQGVLVHGSDWMSEGGTDEDGRKYVYTGGWIGRPAMIWMYCSTSGEFEVKVATEPENGADGGDESETMAKL